MDKQLQIWLDLEETIIDNWNDGYFLSKVTKIKNWLNTKQIVDINIWSYAIWDEDDKLYFQKFYKIPIEDCLGYKIIEYPSVKDVQNFVYDYEKIRYESRTEFMTFNGKFLSFMKYGMTLKDKHIVLIDDAVPLSKLEFPKINVTIETLNVDCDI